MAVGDFRVIRELHCFPPPLSCARLDGQMHWVRRCLLSLLPLAFVGCAILLTEWAYSNFGCTTYGKEFLPCRAYGVDISTFLSFGMFWGKLLLPVAWFISIPWFLYVALSHIEVWWKARNGKQD